MDISKLRQNPKKLKKLPIMKLFHIIQLIDDQITNYKYVTKNYSPEKHEKYSVSYIKGWTDFKDTVEEEISSRQKEEK